VNHGQAMGSDILNLAQRIIDKIKTDFGVSLSIEPIIL
jgi:UDP-N-acetylenolpyruvoylglucosamine reductase